ncbi:MAG: hypothetical protein GX090_02975 [Firmicutes bacterium]|nr:hypothetical protein [Bacillota bacterium]
MWKKVSIILLLGLIFIGGVSAQGETGVVFSMDDPRGDSAGPGTYTYPQDTIFPPELGDMVDLVGFIVSNGPNTTRFEFAFAQPPNLHQPWGGEGFNFHRIDLYIVMGGKGSTDTFRPGAQVEFKRPWQVNLRIRDWKGAYLIHWQDDDPQDPQAGIWQGDVEGFDVNVEGNSIIAELSHDLLGPATSRWKYYVLVGLQDAYGPDQYREITKDGGPWTGGGGCDSEFDPNLYDILAATDSSQQAQLQWKAGQLARLQPVGPGSGAGLVKIIIIAGVALVALGVAVFIWIFRR